MELTCRVCLQVEELMVHIYDEVEDLKSDLSELLEECGGIKVSKSDSYPKYLCKECTSELLIAAKFREKCAQSEQILQQTEAELQAAAAIENEALENQINLLTPVEMEECVNSELQACETNSQLDVNELIIEDRQTDDETIDEIVINSNTKVEIVENYYDDVEEKDEGVEIEGLTNNVKVGEQSLKPTNNYNCDACGAFFMQVMNLQRHMQRAHPKLPLYICDKCQYYFSNETLYEKHCINCRYEQTLIVDMGWKQVGIQPINKKIGASVAPKINDWACSYCDKKFPSSSALKMHERIHTGERPFICKLCRKSFKTQSALTTHLKRHAGTPDYACSYCDKTFYETSNLRAHIRTHTGEKPHVCRLCDKRFTRVYLLQLHMRTHTKEKPYQCSQCERAFAQSCDLRNHILTHTGERRHSCHICGKAFIKRYALQVHLGKHATLIAGNVAQRSETEAEPEDAVVTYTDSLECIDTLTSPLDADFNFNDLIAEEVVLS